jgi:hypothetical protein
MSMSPTENPQPLEHTSPLDMTLDMTPDRVPPATPQSNQANEIPQPAHAAEDPADPGNEEMLARLAVISGNDSNTAHEARKSHPRDRYLDMEMPDIHDIHPMGPLEDIPQDQIKAWTRQKSTGKIIARPFGPQVHSIGNHNEIANDLLTAIKEITEANHISIGKPTNAQKTHSRARAPMAFLIHGISANDAVLLTGRKVWAGPNIAFEAIPFPTPRPSYLFTLRGLATSSEENIKNLVLDTWKDPISIAFFDEVVSKFPVQFSNPLSQEIVNFVESIQIKRVDIKQEGGRDDPHFNIYTNSTLLTSVEIWMDTCNFFRNRCYLSPTLGNGTIKSDCFYCPLCHGKDHPLGLCPFPKLPGWKNVMKSLQTENRRYNDRPARARRSLPYSEPPRAGRPPPRRGGHRAAPY